MNINNPIKDYRASKGWSLKRLADRLGVSVQLISHIENGRRQITAEKAVDWELRTGGEITRYELRPDLFDRRSPQRRAS